MARKKERCMICGIEAKESEYVHATMGEETKVFPLCSTHTIVIGRFLKRSGLAERIVIPSRPVNRGSMSAVTKRALVRFEDLRNHRSSGSVVVLPHTHARQTELRGNT